MPVSGNTLGLLMAAGLEGDALLRVVASIEADNQPKARTNNAERQARFRANKNAKSVTSNVTNNATNNVTPVTPLAHVEDITSNLELDGQKERKQDFVSPKAQPKNGSRIPSDFEPSIRWAMQEGMDVEAAKREAAQFLDYWRAKAGAAARKQDWPKTWQVWVRNAMNRRPTARAGPHRKPNAFDAYNEIARERGWTDETFKPRDAQSTDADVELIPPRRDGPKGAVVDFRGGIAGRFR